MSDSNRKRAEVPEDRLEALVQEIRGCRHCADLPLGPRPVLAVGHRARILIVGQAPGLRVHETGVPWNDPSGDRLRQWLGLPAPLFYDVDRVALVPVGLCYPGRAERGDLAPRPECAPRWAQLLGAHLPNVRLTILAGRYAQAYYLGRRRRATLSETVRHWRDYVPQFIPLPHPSGRNNIWLKANPWFARDVLPEIEPWVRGALQ